MPVLALFKKCDWCCIKEMQNTKHLAKWKMNLLSPGDAFWFKSFQFVKDGRTLLRIFLSKVTTASIKPVWAISTQGRWGAMQLACREGTEKRHVAGQTPGRGIHQEALWHQRLLWRCICDCSPPSSAITTRLHWPCDHEGLWESRLEAL